MSTNFGFAKCQLSHTYLRLLSIFWLVVLEQIKMHSIECVFAVFQFRAAGRTTTMMIIPLCFLCHTLQSYWNDDGDDGDNDNNDRTKIKLLKQQQQKNRITYTYGHTLTVTTLRNFNVCLKQQNENGKKNEKKVCVSGDFVSWMTKLVVLFVCKWNCQSFDSYFFFGKPFPFTFTHIKSTRTHSHTWTNVHTFTISATHCFFGCIQFDVRARDETLMFTFTASCNWQLLLHRRFNKNTINWIEI